MMFLIGKSRCSHRNPRLAAMLGLFSAMMILGASVIERHDGHHWPVAVAGVVCIGLITLAIVRFVALNRDER